MGHEDWSPPPRQSDRCQLTKPTFAGAGGTEKNAPILLKKSEFRKV